MSSKERLRLEVLMIAIKETIGVVVEKTEKVTVLNRIRTQNRSIASYSNIELSSRPPGAGRFRVCFDLPIGDVNRAERA